MYQQYQCIVPSAITICTATTVLKVHQLQYFTATTATSPSVPNCTKLCQFTAPSESANCTNCTIYHYLNFTSALNQVYQPCINAPTATVPSIYISPTAHWVYTATTVLGLPQHVHKIHGKTSNAPKALHWAKQVHQEQYNTTSAPNANKRDTALLWINTKKMSKSIRSECRLTKSVAPRVMVFRRSPQV